MLSADDLAQLRKELDDELKRTPQTPLQAAQYEIQKSFLGKEDVGDLEIIMVPHVFATDPPANDTYYFSFVAALQVRWAFSSFLLYVNGHTGQPEAPDLPWHCSMFQTSCSWKPANHHASISQVRILSRPQSSTPIISTVTLVHSFTSRAALSFHPFPRYQVSCPGDEVYAQDRQH
jgi:hypothetical protein